MALHRDRLGEALRAISVIAIALGVLAWGGYLVPGSYIPRSIQADAVGAGLRVAVVCPENGC